MLLREKIAFVRPVCNAGSFDRIALITQIAMLMFWTLVACYNEATKWWIDCINSVDKKQILAFHDDSTDAPPVNVGDCWNSHMF